MRPVFIMSSERSGSNLVRRMLGGHSAISAPVPPRLWQRWLYTLQNNYQTARQKRQLLREAGREQRQTARRELRPADITPLAPVLDYSVSD